MISWLFVLMQGCIFFYPILFNSPPPVGPFNSPPWSPRLLFSSPLAFYTPGFCVLCLRMYKNTKVFSLYLLYSMWNSLFCPVLLIFTAELLFCRKNFIFLLLFEWFFFDFFHFLFPFFLFFPFIFSARLEFSSPSLAFSSPSILPCI